MVLRTSTAATSTRDRAVLTFMTIVLRTTPAHASAALPCSGRLGTCDRDFAEQQPTNLITYSIDGLSWNDVTPVTSHPHSVQVGTTSGGRKMPIVNQSEIQSKINSAKVIPVSKSLVAELYWIVRMRLII